MVTVKYYRNKRNQNKMLEVHNDGHYHNSVVQYIDYGNGRKNKTGDRCLHRWKANDLRELLEDYEEVDIMKKNASCYLSKESEKSTLLNWLKLEGLIHKANVSQCGDGWDITFHELTKAEFLKISDYLESEEFEKGICFNREDAFFILDILPLHNIEEVKKKLFDYYEDIHKAARVYEYIKERTRKEK